MVTGPRRLNPAFFGEITFIVSEVQIKTFRMPLARISAVFDDLIRATIAESIVIEDDCPDTFKTFVDHICLRKPLNLDFKRAMKMCLIADKYKVAHILDTTLDYMDRNFEYEYGLEYYECLKLVGADRLALQSAKIFCQRHIQSFIDWDHHLNVGIDTLIEIYRSNHLNITSEMVLVVGLAKYKAAHAGADVSEALRHVRFSSMGLATLRTDKTIERLLSEEDIDNIARSIPDEPKHFRERYYASSVCKRTSRDLRRPITVMENTVHSVKVTSLADGNLLGVVIAMPGLTKVPELELVMSVRAEDDGASFLRLRLKDVGAEARKCFFRRPQGFPKDAAVELSIVLNKRIKSAGVWHKSELQPNRALIRYDDEPVSGIHAILAGLIIQCDFH